MMEKAIGEMSLYPPFLWSSGGTSTDSVKLERRNINLLTVKDMD